MAPIYLLLESPSEWLLHKRSYTSSFVVCCFKSHVSPLGRHIGQIISLFSGVHQIRQLDISRDQSCKTPPTRCRKSKKSRVIIYSLDKSPGGLQCSLCLGFNWTAVTFLVDFVCSDYWEILKLSIFVKVNWLGNWTESHRMDWILKDFVFSVPLYNLWKSDLVCSQATHSL